MRRTESEMRIYAFLLSLFAVLLFGLAAAQPAVAQDKILKGSDIAPTLFPITFTSRARPRPPSRVIPAA